MANWSTLQIPQKGLALMAKVIAGQCGLEITKCKFGSGTVADVSNATDLADVKQEFQPTSFVAESTGSCKIFTTPNNSTLVNGYNLSEWGVFANDPDEGEILYGYFTDANPDYMPGRAETTTMYAVTMSATIQVHNSQDITVNVNPAGAVSLAEVTALIEEHDKKAAAHYGLLHVLERGKAYILNDVANHEALPSWLQLKCTAAGTTDNAVEPNLAGANEGDTIVDGSATWKVTQAGGGSSSTGFFKVDDQGYIVLKADNELISDPAFEIEAGTGYITLKP